MMRYFYVLSKMLNATTSPVCCTSCANSLKLTVGSSVSWFYGKRLEFYDGGTANVYYGGDRHPLGGLGLNSEWGGIIFFVFIKKSTESSMCKAWLVLNLFLKLLKSILYCPFLCQK